MESMLSSGSGFSGGSGINEKRKVREKEKYGFHNGGHPDSYYTSTDPRSQRNGHHRGGSESPVDPRLTPSPPPLSYSNTVTTTIRSDMSPKPGKHRKKNSRTMLESTYNDRRGTPVYDYTAHTVPLPPSARMTRSNSVETYHSAQPEWWAYGLAPVPPSIPSRTPSPTRARSRPGTSETQRSFIRNSGFTDLSLFADDDYGHFSHYDDPIYRPHTAAHRGDLQSMVSYPGRVGERVVRTASGREAYVIDGIGEALGGGRDMIERPDSVDSGSVRRFARGAGRAH